MLGRPLVQQALVQYVLPSPPRRVLVLVSARFQTYADLLEYAAILSHSACGTRKIKDMQESMWPFQAHVRPNLRSSVLKPYLLVEDELDKY